MLSHLPNSRSQRVHRPSRSSLVDIAKGILKLKRGASRAGRTRPKTSTTHSFTSPGGWVGTNNTAVRTGLLLAVQARLDGAGEHECVASRRNRISPRVASRRYYM